MTCFMAFYFSICTASLGPRYHFFLPQITMIDSTACAIIQGKVSIHSFLYFDALKRWRDKRVSI